MEEVLRREVIRANDSSEYCATKTRFGFISRGFFVVSFLFILLSYFVCFLF